MRIEARYGADTGMYLVYVYLESDRECALSHRKLWAKMRPLLAAEGVHVDVVVDFYLQRRGPGGDWVSAGPLSWSDQ
jgi:hypothetical protein